MLPFVLLLPSFFLFFLLLFFFFRSELRLELELGLGLGLGLLPFALPTLELPFLSLVTMVLSIAPLFIVPLWPTATASFEEFVELEGEKEGRDFFPLRVKNRSAILMISLEASHLINR